MIFHYMVEHLHLICRHAGYEHVANPSCRQYGKAFLCAIHKGISITFAFASPSDPSKKHKADTVYPLLLVSGCRAMIFMKSKLMNSQSTDI